MVSIFPPSIEGTGSSSNSLEKTVVVKLATTVCVCTRRVQCTQFLLVSSLSSQLPRSWTCLPGESVKWLQVPSALILRPEEAPQGSVGVEPAGYAVSGQGDQKDILPYDKDKTGLDRTFNIYKFLRLFQEGGSRSSGQDFSTVFLICVDGKVQLRVKSKTAASRSSSSRSPGCTVHSLYITVQEYLEVSAVRQVDKVRLCQLLPARQDGRLQGPAHTESCRCH